MKDRRRRGSLHKVAGISIVFIPALIWIAASEVISQAPSPQNEGLPDLGMEAERARESITIVQRNFTADSCAIQEQCVSAPGLRRLLLFDAQITNRGDADFILGDPAQNPLFENSACHGHPHLLGFTQYELIRPSDNQAVAVVRKQGFCIMDTHPITTPSATASETSAHVEGSGTGGGIPPVPGSSGLGNYDCGNQGLSVGWADVYTKDIECQWLDITDVPPGNYVLKVTANPDGRFAEKNLNNNTAEVSVTIPPPNVSERVADE